jgi:uncharacterized membrane protein
MAKEYVHPEGVKSTAAIAGHPLHPAVIPFPIAFLVGALLTDIVYAANGDDFWARMSFWLIVGGLVTGLAAAVLGLIDFLTIERVRAHQAGWIHAGGNVAAMVLSAINLVLRLDDPASAVTLWGLILSALVTVLLLITGWFGGELAFRHKIGVIENED